MRAILKNLLTGEEVRVVSTTEHPASSYGQAVWVDEDGQAYGQSHVMRRGGVKISNGVFVQDRDPSQIFVRAEF